MKKILQSILLISIISIIFSSCEKEIVFDECTDNGCIIFEGYVLDMNNDIPVEGASIEAIFDDGHFASIWNTRNIVGKSVSNKEGYFRISISGEGYERDRGFFQIEISRTDYLKRTRNFFSVDSTKFDIPILVDGNVLPKAELDLIIRTGDKIKNLEYSLFIGYKKWHFKPAESSLIDTTYNYEVAGDQFNLVNYNYKRYGTQINTLDSVYIDKGAKGQIIIDIE